MAGTGWYPDPASDEVIRYWDGSAWTAEQAWDGTGWVEVAVGSTAVEQPAAPVPVLAAPEAVEPAAPSAPPPPAVQPAAPPSPGSSPGRARAWLRPVVIGLLAVTAAVIAGAVTLVLFRSGDDSVASRPASSETNRSTVPDRSTTTSASSTTVPPPPPPPPPPASLSAVVGRVFRTCGAGGNGDCFLSVRSAPNAGGTEIRRLDEGDAVVVECQVQGDAVRSSVLGQTSTAWSRTPDGDFVASIFVEAAGFDPLTVSVPCP